MAVCRQNQRFTVSIVSYLTIFSIQYLNYGDYFNILNISLHNHLWFETNAIIDGTFLQFYINKMV